MTRISDAMRAAADRAPVANVHITTSATAARVRRHRAMRGGANGLVGAGAVALLVAGAFGSGGLAKDGRSSLSGGTAGEGAPEPGVATDNGGGGFAAPDIARACGYTFAADSRGSDISITAEPAATTIDPGAPLSVTVTATTTTVGEFAASQPMAYVLWNGLVVSEVPADSLATSWSASAGDTLVTDASLKLTNCWDDSPLPSGSYTVVVAQDFSAGVTPEPLPEPSVTPEPLPEPSVTPEPGTPPVEPTVDPNTSVSSDGSSSSGSASSGTASSGTVTTPIDVQVVRAYAKPFELTISGDAAKDPFGAYLSTVTQPTLPDGVVTPDEARAAYKAGETSLRWNMAAGTQRVVMTTSGPNASANEWQSTYYGCPTDGSKGTFPSSSADLGWLDVSASLPSSVHVSYGWIVDGNPRLAMKVTNTSPWTLPGFYGQPNAVMYLVKDGRVVAEAYPVSPDRGRGGVAIMETGVAGMEKAGAGADSDLMFAPGSDGYLAAGESLSGDYLWRDVNGCWSKDGPSDVAPGTYTILTMQDIFVGGGVIYTMGVDTGGGFVGMDGGAATLPGTTWGSTDPAGATAVEPQPFVEPRPDQNPDGVDAPAPGPDQQDFASFQVWTSLGTVTVTG